MSTVATHISSYWRERQPYVARMRSMMSFDVRGGADNGNSAMRSAWFFISSLDYFDMGLFVLRSAITSTSTFLSGATMYTAKKPAASTNLP
jgi:hypothetical protein